MKTSFVCAGLAILFAVAIVTLSPRLAHAALDPATAEADAHGLIQSSDYSFCSKPGSPLSIRARELCPLAGEIPGCSALVLECDKALEKPPEPSAFWIALAKWLALAAPYVAWGVVGLLVLGVLYLAYLAIRAATDDVQNASLTRDADVTLVPDAPMPPDVTAAEALLQLATEARARGDYKQALFLYLAAALRALDERGAIRIARDRTNGEYLRSCREAAARPTLRELVREVDGVQFGGRDATAETAAAAETRAVVLVRAPREDVAQLAAPALLMLSLLFALGACNGPGSNSRDNPAGRDLLVELLTKQGATISSLPGSLANLPMKGAKGPVVILDAERVPLEDETRDHLVAWVKQGGTLVLAGGAGLWPSELWAKPTGTACSTGPCTLRVEARTAPPPRVDDDDDDDDVPVPPTPPHAWNAKLAQGVAMTWPSEDRAPLAVARLEDGELYGALRVFGEGKVLGLASTDLLSNAGLAVPGNAAALVAMLATLDRQEFAVARTEQGIAPPSNPFAGLMRIGLGPALAHLAVFIPILFLAYGVRHAAPRVEPPPRRRAFAEHVQAVGALYAQRRAASHALSVYGKHVDDRVRGRMARGGDPAQFLAMRSGADAAEVAEIYSRAMGWKSERPARGDELRVIERLAALYAKAMERG